jgi:hypothetical protein
MYRPFYAEAAIYPPNQFLETAMTTTKSLAAPVEQAMQNLRRAGILGAS